MEKYVIIVTPRSDVPIQEMVEFTGGEYAAIREASRIFREKAMHKVAVVGEELNVVYKQIRICKCTNVQQELDGAFHCMACGVEVNYSGWKQEEIMEEA